VITLTREEAQQMLDALEKISMGGHPDWANDVTPILRTRLAQPEPEPQEAIAKWIKTNTEHREWYICPKCSYQAPRFKDEWQGLTDEEIMEMCVSAGFGRGSMRFNLIVQAIEAKLKGKNI
jgi:hypothetical protein